MLPNMPLGVARIKAEIKLKPVYRCKCGASGVGHTMYLEIDTNNVNNLVYSLNNLEARPSHMPVGWASYYSPTGTDIRCPACQ